MGLPARKVNHRPDGPPPKFRVLQPPRDEADIPDRLGRIPKVFADELDAFEKSIWRWAAREGWWLQKYDAPLVFELCRTAKLMRDNKRHFERSQAYLAELLESDPGRAQKVTPAAKLLRDAYADNVLSWIKLTTELGLTALSRSKMAIKRNTQAREAAQQADPIAEFL